MQITNRTEGLAQLQKPPEFPLLEINYRKLTFEQIFSGKRLLKEEYDFAWLDDGSFLYDENSFFPVRVLQSLNLPYFSDFICQFESIAFFLC